MIVFILIFLFIIAWCVELRDTNPHARTLEKDGYTVMDNPDAQEVLSKLPRGYQFMDYNYFIKGCSLSTFHRDVTSSGYVFNTKHPVYTYIVYEYEGPQISLCPGSNKTVPFLWSLPRAIHGKRGTSVLFDCDVVHAGCINTVGSERNVRQYKIAHVDDIPTLASLQGVSTQKIGACNVSKEYELLTRKCSLMMSYSVNHLLTPYLQKEHDDTLGKFVLWLFGGRKFYNGVS